MSCKDTCKNYEPEDKCTCPSCDGFVGYDVPGCKMTVHRYVCVYGGHYKWKPKGTTASRSPMIPTRTCNSELDVQEAVARDELAEALATTDFGDCVDNVDHLLVGASNAARYRWDKWGEDGRSHVEIGIEILRRIIEQHKPVVNRFERQAAELEAAPRDELAEALAGIDDLVLCLRYCANRAETETLKLDAAATRKAADLIEAAIAKLEEKP